jgi:uroporphyrinogen-III synthase
MAFTHVFISRPRKESQELASMLTPMGLKPVIQPAFNYFPLDARASQTKKFEEMENAGTDALVIFTSPRAVVHGLSQLPQKLLFQARVAAIGPATAKALGDAGIRVTITPHTGYTSEALLDTLSEENPNRIAEASCAFIIAAPGGRKKLLDSLARQGWKAMLIKVYKSQPAELDKQVLSALKEASGVLSVWTSANAMKGLSQRLPPATWFQLCQGDWLVISERLRRLARAYGPERIHLCAGPGNKDLLNSIRGLI